MEWTLKEGDIVKQVACVNDIATAVKNVMNDSSEFVILTPPETIGDCNFMQASKIGEDIFILRLALCSHQAKIVFIVRHVIWTPQYSCLVNISWEMWFLT